MCTLDPVEEPRLSERVCEHLCPHLFLQSNLHPQLLLLTRLSICLQTAVSSPRFPVLPTTSKALSPVTLHRTYNRACY